MQYFDAFRVVVFLVGLGLSGACGAPETNQSSHREDGASSPEPASSSTLSVQRVPSSPQTGVVPILADTALNEPHVNRGSEDEAVVLGDRYRTVLRFGQAQIDQAFPGDLTSANLVLKFAPVPLQNDGKKLEIRRLHQAWDELSATWFCADDQDPAPQQWNESDCGAEDRWHGGNSPWSAPTAIIDLTTGATEASVDVLADLQAFRRGDLENHGWAIVAAQGDDAPVLRTILGTKEAGATAPSLEITSTAGPYDPDLVQEPPRSLPTEGVYLHAGAYTEMVTDLFVRGRVMSTDWTRTYRSRFGTSSAQGNGWDHSYNIYVERVVAHTNVEDDVQYAVVPNIVLHSGNGRRDTLDHNGSGTYAKAGFFKEGSINSSDEFELRHADGTTFKFVSFEDDVAPGKIYSIQDRNSNTTTFLYDDSGRLATIVDDRLRGLQIRYDTSARIEHVTDFGGRTVSYSYYGEGESGGGPGDLRSVTYPPVVGTPNGNDFPLGKTVTYTYSTGFSDARLNHNLLSITDARGNTARSITYAATTSPENAEFDRIQRQTLGAAHKSTTYVHEAVTPSPGNQNAIWLAIVNDRVGNVSEHYFDASNRRVMRRRYTGRADPDQPTGSSSNRPAAKVRASDPDYFETRWEYNPEHLLTRVARPAGDVEEFLYESDVTPTVPPRARGDLLLRTSRADMRPGACTSPELVTTFEYEAPGDQHGPGFRTKVVDANGGETTFERDLHGNVLHIERPDPEVVEDFEYNDFGQLTKRIFPPSADGIRRTEDIAYVTCTDEMQNCPTLGFLRQVTVSGGGLSLVTHYGTDDLGNFTSVTTPDDHTTAYTFNEYDSIVQVLPPPVDGAQCEQMIAYDENNNVVREDWRNLDETGQPRANLFLTKEKEYDDENLLTAIIQDDGDLEIVTNEIVRAADGSIIATRFGEAAGGFDPSNTLTYTYDERGYAYRETRGEGGANPVVTQYDYGPDGAITAFHTGVGSAAGARIHARGQDCHGRLSRATDAMGNVTEVEYDALGNITKKRSYGELMDEEGDAGNVLLSEAEFTYDGVNRRTATRTRLFDPATGQPLGTEWATTTTEYAPNGSVTRTTDALGNATTFEYDGIGRRRSTTDAAGNKTAVVYDDDSRVTTTTETWISSSGGPPKTSVTSFTYDVLGRKRTSTDPLGNVTEYEYDCSNNLVNTIEPDGSVTHVEYDGMARIVEIQQDLATGVQTVQTFDWDDTSRIAARTDDSGNTTFYVHNGHNQEIGRHFSDGTEVAFQYNEYGDLSQITDPRGTVVDVTYDPLGRTVDRSIAPGSGVSNDTTFEHYGYRGDGTLILATNDASTVTRTYDSRGALLQESIDGAVVGVVSDTMGRPTRVTYPQGSIVDYGYDGVGRLRAAALDALPIADLDYLGPSSREGITYNPTGGAAVVQADFVRDALGRPESAFYTHDPSGSATMIYSDATTWNEVGDTLQRTVSGVGPAASYAYEHDLAHQLVRTTVRDAGAQVLRDTVYSIDGVGNWNSVLDGECSGTYSLDSTAPNPADAQMNQYTQTGCDTRQYDTAGNLVLRQGATTTSFVYDFANRLVGYSDPATSHSGTYLYDALGRKIRTVVDDGTGPITTDFSFLDDSVVEEREGTSTRSLVRGTDMDSILAAGTPSGVQFYIQDDAGTVLALIGEDGEVIEGVEYSDYGVPHVYDGDGTSLGASSSAGNRYLLGGRPYDDLVGLYDIRNRALDPAVGRFVQRDPLGVWGDETSLGNGCSYVGNQPTTATDPLGLFKTPKWRRRKCSKNDRRMLTNGGDSPFSFMEDMAIASENFMNSFEEHVPDDFKKGFWNGGTGELFFGKWSNHRYNLARMKVGNNAKYATDKKLKISCQHRGNCRRKQPNAWTLSMINAEIRLCTKHASLWNRIGATADRHRGNTLLHELSHHRAGVADWAGDPGWRGLAREHPYRAVHNAENYEHFGDEVLLTQERPSAVPPPGSGPGGLPPGGGAGGGGTGGGGAGGGGAGRSGAASNGGIGQPPTRNYGTDQPPVPSNPSSLPLSGGFPSQSHNGTWHPPTHTR